MWEIFEWPPRSPRSAWIFIGAIFFAAILGLIILFSV